MGYSHSTKYFKCVWAMPGSFPVSCRRCLPGCAPPLRMPTLEETQHSTPTLPTPKSIPLGRGRPRLPASRPGSLPGTPPGPAAASHPGCLPRPGLPVSRERGSCPVCAIRPLDKAQHHAGRRHFSATLKPCRWGRESDECPPICKDGTASDCGCGVAAAVINGQYYTANIRVREAAWQQRQLPGDMTWETPPPPNGREETKP